MRACPGWTVTLHRGTAGIGAVADYARARGAIVIWCGPGCCAEEDDVSVSGDPGLDEAPALPAAESRGGERPDWERARPGQPLPELPEHEHDLGGEG